MALLEELKLGVMVKGLLSCVFFNTKTRIVNSIPKNRFCCSVYGMLEVQAR